MLTTDTAPTTATTTAAATIDTDTDDMQMLLPCDPPAAAANSSSTAAPGDYALRQELAKAMRQMETLRRERDWLLDRLVQYDAVLVPDSDLVADHTPTTAPTSDPASSPAAAPQPPAGKRKLSGAGAAIIHELQSSSKKPCINPSTLPQPTASNASTQLSPPTASSLTAFADMTTPHVSSATATSTAALAEEKLGALAEQQKQQQQHNIDAAKHQQSTATSTTTSATTQHGNAKHTRKTPENRVRKVRPLHVNPDKSITVAAKYGPVQLLSLGRIVTEEAGSDIVAAGTAGSYHTDRYIYPVGYKVVRYYFSTTDATVDNAEYICQIVAGETGPRFEVYATADPSQVWQGRTTSGAWAAAINLAYGLRNRQPTTAICGPDLFALTSAEIAKAIQELPGADKCARYKWQTFVEEDAPPVASSSSS